jgi:hypothetical protein
MDRGFVPLWRKSRDSQVFKDAALWHLWSYILLSARGKPGWVYVSTGRSETEVFLDVGQMIFGRNTVAHILKQKPISTYKRLLKLEKMGNVNIQNNTHYSLITVNNWVSYVDFTFIKEHATGQPSNNQGTTKEQPSNTKNNDNHEDNENHENTCSSENLPLKPSKTNCPHKQIIELYHSLLPTLPSVRVWGDANTKNLQARWGEDKNRQNLSWWDGYFTDVANTPFLLGQNDRKWIANLGWLVKKESMVKVLNGNYSRHKPPGYVEEMSDCGNAAIRACMEARKLREKHDGT